MLTPSSPRELLDGLRRVSYKLNKGIKDTGFLLLLKQKGGGHYFSERLAIFHAVDSTTLS
jgi:hypothetical protein